MSKKTRDNGKRIKSRRRFRLIKLRLLKTGGVRDKYIQNLER